MAVFPRNAGYEHEWIGNFNIGADGVHAGFAQARDQIRKFMAQYVEGNGISGPVKVWSAGYSRGAGTANLLGGYLAETAEDFEGVTVAPEDLFVYTIGTPMTIAGDSKPADPSAAPYRGIHNFIAYGDFIAKLPPKSWGFDRYGVTEEIEYGDEAMLAWLRPLSESTAATFANGGYSAPRPVRTLDLDTFSLIDAPGFDPISPDAMIEKRLEALMGMVDGRASLIEMNYQSLLGDAAAIYGTDFNGFYQGIANAGAGELIKTGVLNYLAYAAAQQRKTNPERSDRDAITEALVQALRLAGIEADKTYSEQQMLADILDFMFNDLQSADPAKKANVEARSALIKSKLPEAFLPLYTGLLNDSVEKGAQMHTVDDVIAVISGFVLENADNRAAIKAVIPANYQPSYQDLMDYIVGAGVEPPKSFDELFALLARSVVATSTDSESVSKLLDEFAAAAEAKGMRDTIVLLGVMCTGTYYDPSVSLKEIILDILRALYEGANGTDAAQLRSNLLNTMISPMVLNCPNIGALITKPKGSTEIQYLVEDLLNLALPKDENGQRLTVTKAADAALTGLLQKGLTQKISKYVTELAGNPSDVRAIVAKLFFQPEDGYSLSSDVRSAVTFVDMLMFLYPSHNHELYISWLKTKASRVVFDSNGGSAVEDVAGLAYGSAVPKPADPTRPGYSFGGWYKDEALTQVWAFDGETVQEVYTVLHAKWTPERITLTFDTDGGSTVDPITQDYGTAVTAPVNPTKEGYTFDGWDPEIPATMPANDLTVKAKWEKVRIKILDATAGNSAAPAKLPDNGENFTVRATIQLPENLVKEIQVFMVSYDAHGRFLALKEASLDQNGTELDTYSAKGEIENDGSVAKVSILVLDKDKWVPLAQHKELTK